MPEVVISDTSCLILLTKINELELLKNCYTRVVVSKEVAAEYGDPLPAWMEVKSVQDIFVQKTLEQLIDGGEASSFALALAIPDSLVIVDDRKARRVAKGLGLKVTGTLGVFVKAKELGHVKLIVPILTKLSATDFRVSEKLKVKILELTGEKL